LVIGRTNAEQVIAAFHHCSLANEHIEEWCDLIERGLQENPPIQVIDLAVIKKQKRKNECSKPNTHRHLQTQFVNTIAEVMERNCNSMNAVL